MAVSTEIGGDVVAAAGALAGLMLVYMGALSAGYSSYDVTAKRVVRGSYRRRIWFAFAGLVLNAASIPFGLVSKALDNLCALYAALGLLLLGVGWLIAVAVLTALEVK